MGQIFLLSGFILIGLLVFTIYLFERTPKVVREPLPTPKEKKLETYYVEDTLNTHRFFITLKDGTQKELTRKDNIVHYRGYWNDYCLHQGVNNVSYEVEQELKTQIYIRCDDQSCINREFIKEYRSEIIEKEKVQLERTKSI